MAVRRQNLETGRLMGVPFVPVRMSVTDAPDAPGAPPIASATPHATPETAGTAIDKSAALEALAAEHAAECPHCARAEGIRNIVFGEGNPDADLMFIGEAPGAEEDRTGRPFVGRAGRKLDEMILSIGLAREDTYIANVLKARPPNNRTPLASEIDACGPYLARQIRIIAPRVIVTLGGPAGKLLLGTDLGITRVRGVWSVFQTGDLSIDVMPTFHPAYLLRNYTRETREKVWSDLQAVAARLSR